MSAKTFTLVAALVAASTGASAQGALRCSAFLHLRDGTWRSLEEADIFGPNGIVHLRNGEILSPTTRSAQGEIASGLNELCESR